MCVRGRSTVTHTSSSVTLSHPSGNLSSFPEGLKSVMKRFYLSTSKQQSVSVQRSSGSHRQKSIVPRVWLLATHPVSPNKIQFKHRTGWTPATPPPPSACSNNSYLFSDSLHLELSRGCHSLGWMAITISGWSSSIGWWSMEYRTWSQRIVFKCQKGLNCNSPEIQEWSSVNHWAMTTGKVK